MIDPNTLASEEEQYLSWAGVPTPIKVPVKRKLPPPPNTSLEIKDRPAPIKRTLLASRVQLVPAGYDKRQAVVQDRDDTEFVTNLQGAIQEGPNQDPWRNLMLWEAAETSQEFQARNKTDQLAGRKAYFEKNILPYAKSSEDRAYFDEFIHPKKSEVFLGRLAHGIVPFVKTPAEQRQALTTKLLDNVTSEIPKNSLRIVPPPEHGRSAVAGETIGQLLPMAAGGLFGGGLASFAKAPAFISRFIAGSASMAIPTAYRWAAGDATPADIRKAALEGALGWGPKSILLGGALSGAYAAATSPQYGTKQAGMTPLTRGLAGAAQVVLMRAGFEKAAPAAFKSSRSRILEYQMGKAASAQEKLLESQGRVNLGSPKSLEAKDIVAAQEARTAVNKRVYELTPMGQIERFIEKHAGRNLEIDNPMQRVAKVVATGEEDRISANIANTVREGMLTRSNREVVTIGNALIRNGRAEEHLALQEAQEELIKILQTGTQEQALVSWSKLDNLLARNRKLLVETAPEESIGVLGFVSLTKTGYEKVATAGSMTKAILHEIDVASAGHGAGIDFELFNTLSSTPGPFGWSPKSGYLASILMKSGGALAPEKLKLYGESAQTFPDFIQTLLDGGLIQVGKFPGRAAGAFKTGNQPAKLTVGSADFSGTMPEDLKGTLNSIQNSNLPAAEKEALRRMLLDTVLPRTAETGTLMHRGVIASPSSGLPRTRTESEVHAGVGGVLQQKLPAGTLLDTAKIHFAERLDYHIDMGFTPDEALTRTMQEINGFDFAPHMGGTTKVRDFIRAIEANSEKTWPEDILMVETSTDWGQGPVTTVRPRVDIVSGTPDAPVVRDPLKPVRLMRIAGVQGEYDSRTGSIRIKDSNGVLVPITIEQLEALPRAGSATPRGGIVITTQTGGWVVSRNNHNGKYEYTEIDLKTKQPTGASRVIHKKDLMDALYVNKGWIVRSELPDGSLIVADAKTGTVSAKTPDQIKAAMSNPKVEDLSFGIKVPPKASSVNVNAAEPMPDTIVGLTSEGLVPRGTKPDVITEDLANLGAEADYRRRIRFLDAKALVRKENISLVEALNRIDASTKPPSGSRGSTTLGFLGGGESPFGKGSKQKDIDFGRKVERELQEAQYSIDSNNPSISMTRSRVKQALELLQGNTGTLGKKTLTSLLDADNALLAGDTPLFLEIIKGIRQETKPVVFGPLPQQRVVDVWATGEVKRLNALSKPPKLGEPSDGFTSGSGGTTLGFLYPNKWPTASIEKQQVARVNLKDKPLLTRAGTKLGGMYQAGRLTGGLLTRYITPKKSLFAQYQDKFGIPILEVKVAADAQYRNLIRFSRENTPLLQKTVRALEGRDQRAILNFVAEADLGLRAKMLQSSTNPNGLTSKEVAVATDAETILRRSLGPTWNRMLTEDYPNAVLGEASPVWSTWRDKGDLSVVPFQTGNLAGLLSNVYSAHSRMSLSTVTDQMTSLIEGIKSLPTAPPPRAKEFTGTAIREGPPGTPQLRTVQSPIVDRRWLPEVVQNRLIKEISNVQQQLMHAVSTDRIAAERFMEGTLRYLGLTEEQVPRALLKSQFVPNFLLLTYSGTMPFKSSIVIKNMAQGLQTTSLYAGANNFAKGIVRSLTKEGRQLGRDLKLDTYSAVPMEHLLGGGGVETGFVARRAQNLRHAYETGMKPMEWTDYYNRLVAANTGYAAVEAHAPAFLAGKSTLSQFLRETGIVYLEKQVQLDIIRGFKRGDWKDVAVSYAKNLHEDTHWLYNAGNSAEVFNTKVGRFLGQFGTWPTHFLRFLQRGLTSGDIVATKNFMARFALVNGAITEVGREIFGVDPSNWLAFGPLQYAGGVGAEVATQTREFMLGGYRGEQGLRRLKSVGATMIPFYGAFKQVKDLVWGEGDTAENIKKATGMRPYER